MVNYLSRIDANSVKFSVPARTDSGVCKFTNFSFFFLFFLFIFLCEVEKRVCMCVCIEKIFYSTKQKTLRR